MNLKKHLSPVFEKTGKKWPLKNYLFRVEVSFLTVIFVTLSLVFNYYPYLFIHYLIALIHELSHIAIALIMKVKVKRIKFLPFGFFAEFEGFEETKPLTQFLILIAGPLSFFISALMLKSLYQGGVFSYYAYRSSQNSNLLIALFNLIPFYPMDGARLVEIMIANVLNAKKTIKFRNIISAFALALIGFITIKERQYPLVIYLLVIYIMQLILSKKEYILFLIRRLTKAPPRRKRITSKDEVYRYHHTLKLGSGGLEDEKAIITRLLKDVKLD